MDVPAQTKPTAESACADHGDEVMPSERIEEEDKRRRHQCYEATARAAGVVRDAFEKERAGGKPLNRKKWAPLQGERGALPSACLSGCVFIWRFGSEGAAPSFNKRCWRK